MDSKYKNSLSLQGGGGHFYHQSTGSAASRIGSSQLSKHHHTITPQHDRNVSNSPSLKEALFDSDMQFFESMVQGYQEELSQSLMHRRESVRKDDPFEELSELYSEIKDQETKFRKVLEVCVFMIDKNKELYNENYFLQQDMEKTLAKQTMLEDQNHILFQENRRLAESSDTKNGHVKDLENLIEQLRDEIDQKNMMLEEYEQNMDVSRHSERNTQFSSNLISAQELSELKHRLAEQIKKAKEFEQLLNHQSMKYEMELKKSNTLLNENKKLKEQTKELNFQIDEFNEILEEKDQKLEEYEELLKQLEAELNKKQFVEKQKTFKKQNQGQFMNPLAQTQLTITRQKSKMDYDPELGQFSSEIKLTKKYSQFPSDPLISKDKEVVKNEKNIIRLKSQMENFREVVHHQRKGSCPLVLIDKAGSKFKIYDKEFQIYSEQKYQGEKKKPSDDKKVAPPPEFYPFNELEQEVEEAQVMLRVPSSLRFQTEYVSKIGLHLQDILNRQTGGRLKDKVDEQQNESELEEEELEDQDESAYGAESEENDTMGGSLLREAQMKNNHETFRPVSILDNGGLEINEDDLIYDQNLRATLNVTGNFQGDLYSRDTMHRGNFDSFADRHGSFQQDGSIILENGEIYSPEINARESMYNRQSNRKSNRISLMMGSTTDKKQKGNNFQSVVDIETPAQIIEEHQQEEEDVEEILNRKNRSLFRKVGLQIIVDDDNGEKNKKDNNNNNNNANKSQSQIRESQSSQDSKGIANSKQVPIDTPSFKAEKMAGNIFQSAFMEPQSDTKLRIKNQANEEHKVNSHKKKPTDSTQVGISNQNQHSPHTAQISQEEFNAINDSRSQIQCESVMSSNTVTIPGSYQPNHSNSQIIANEQLMAHHMRMYSSNNQNKNIGKDDESGSPSKIGGPDSNNNHPGSRQAAESSHAGRGSHSAGSGNKSPSQQSRKDPNEEFFMMTLVSYKLNHKEYEKILTIDGKDLYLQVQKEQKPFYEWNKWIESKLERYYLEQMYRRKQKQESQKPGFKDQSSKLTSKINIEMNYF